MSEVLSDVVPAVVDHDAALLAKVRARNPRVHCITNTVAQALTDGPGSLAFAILDSLHAMTPDMVMQDAWAEA